VKRPRPVASDASAAAIALAHPGKVNALAGKELGLADRFGARRERDRDQMIVDLRTRRAVIRCGPDVCGAVLLLGGPCEQASSRASEWLPIVTRQGRNDRLAVHTEERSRC